MDLTLEWYEPFDLKDGSRQNLIYSLDDSDLQYLPEAPGVYVFARQHGAVTAPLYIGRAENLAARIMQQLNNVRLMNGLRAAQSGYRMLLVGEFQARQGQQVDRALALIESALIRYALAEGYELLNLKGTKTRVHTIASAGNRVARSWLRRNIQVDGT